MRAQFLKQLLPPIVVDGIRYFRRLQKPVIAEWEYVPYGWASKDPRVKGWNVESVAQSENSKWPRFLELTQGTDPLGVNHEDLAPIRNSYSAHNTVMTFAYVLGLTALKRDKISVLDWGGGMGHYYILSRALVPDVILDYHCKDLPALCRHGRLVLPEVIFHEDEHQCWEQSYDLVFASSSLQYCKDWKSTLARLASVSGCYLFITRLPIVRNSPSFVVVQRPYALGYSTEYLGWFLNRDEFLNQASALKMKLIREFMVQEEHHVFNAPEQGVYRGFLFRS